MHAFERFSPSIRGARCRWAPETGSLYPYKPIPDKSLPYQEETALGPGRPRVPAAGYGQPLPKGRRPIKPKRPKQPYTKANRNTSSNVST